MDIKELIQQDESPKLDFKREWYKEADLKTEFLKDIIALTNGNIHTIGQSSFLIIGVKENPNGNEIHNVVLTKSLDEIKKQLLQNLQNLVTPSIQDVEMSFFEVESKNILVIQIPFHNYPIILKDKLRQHKKDTFLYRAGEGTVEADYATRKAFDDAMVEYNKNNSPTPNLIKISNELPPLRNSSLTPLPPINTNFIGRTKELKTIEENLNSDNVVCVVNGIGGVGKSELSYAYLHQHKDEYNKIAFIEMTQESGTLEEVFRIKFQDELHLSAEDSFDTIIKRLQSFDKPNLLLMDNLLSEDDFKKIKPLNVNFDILITTRAKLNSKNTLNLETLNPQDAKELFLSIYDTDEDISTILKYLDRHPLFIRLTAYSLFEEYIELDELKANIKSGALADIDSEDDKTFKEHLQDTFNKQFQDEKNEDLKVLLQTLALFPAIEIDFEMLKKMLGGEKLKPKLQKLVSRGWLTRKENSYKLHQIIKEFMLTEYPIEYEEVVYVLENIGKYIDPYDTIIIASSLNGYIPIVEALLYHFEEKKDNHIASILDSLTYLFYSLGEYNNALGVQKESLAIRDSLFDEKSKEVALSYDLIGIVYYSKGEYEKAEVIYEKSLKIREEILGKSHFNTAISYNNLAVLYKLKGEYAKAEFYFKKSLKIRKELLGENHSNTAESYGNLALLYKSKGEYDKAEPLFKKALATHNLMLEENHPLIATSCNNLALFYNLKEEYEKAEVLFTKALKISKNVLGENHASTATAYNNLAGLFYLKEEYEKAEVLFKKSLKMREKLLGENHLDTVTSYGNLALFYKDRKLCSKAKVLLEECVELVEKLEYYSISLIDIKRALKEVEDSLKKEKRAKFNKKGRFCRDR